MALRNDYVELFFSYILAEKRLSQNTYFAYKQDIEQFLAFLKTVRIPLQQCSTQELKIFLKKMKDSGLKSRSMSRKISTLKALFSFLSERFAFKNSAAQLIFPKIEKTLPYFLTEQDIYKLFEIAGLDKTLNGQRNKVMLYLLYASGMRISELISLKKEQVNFQTGFIQLLGKGNKERMVPLPQPVLELLREYLDLIYPALFLKAGSDIKQMPIDNLFFTPYKNRIKPISRQAFWLMLKRWLLKAHLPARVSPHSLRHSLATHLLSSGVDLRTLQLLLGHASIVTVNIYTHVTNNELRSIYDSKHPRKK